MKIKSILFSFLFFCPLLAQAQVTVVRVDKDQVYLDISSAAGQVHPGDTFKVITSSEKLVNPKTGKDLGLIHTYSAEGKITEVQPLYAVGELPKGTAVSVGQEIVWENATPAESVAPAKAEQKITSKHTVVSYEPVDQEIISLSEANITDPQANNIVTLSSKGLITVWTRNQENLEEKASYQLPKQKTPLTLSAVPVRGKDTSEIFATVYDAHQARLSTLVLSYENGQWKELENLPYFVKEQGCAQDKTLWMQKPFAVDHHPANAREMIYKNNQFKPGEKTFPTQRNWLPGLLQASIESAEADNFIYTSSSGKLKMKLANGKMTESKNLFGSSPSRIKYKQEIVKFYPSLQLVSWQDKPTIVGVENMAKYGLLSSTFGMYQNGKIHFLSYGKGRFNIIDSVELDGFVYDTACGKNSILTAEVLPDGQSAVVEILN